MKWKSSSNAKASTATTAKAGCCTAPPATRNRKPACAVPGLAVRQGLTENDYRWLSPEQLAQQIRIAKPYGGIYAPHVATIHPAKLVRGLARTVERMGVRSTKTARSPTGSPVACARPSLGRSRWVVPAVEGYSVTLPPLGVTSCRCRA
jgi:glycine/D-amino acid oxidase-like deaminating enzyme